MHLHITHGSFNNANTNEIAAAALGFIQRGVGAPDGGEADAFQRFANQRRGVGGVAASQPRSFAAFAG